MKAEIAKIEWNGRPVQGALKVLEEGKCNRLVFYLSPDDYSFVRYMLHNSEGVCSVLKPVPVEKAFVTQVVSESFGNCYLVVEWEKKPNQES